MTTMLLFTVLATLIEGLVEYFVGTIFDHVPKIKEWRWLTIYIPPVLGVIVAIAYQLDLLSLIVAGLPASTLGMILSGLIMGRGANYLHQFVATFFPRPTIPEGVTIK